TTARLAAGRPRDGPRRPGRPILIGACVRPARTGGCENAGVDSGTSSSERDPLATLLTPQRAQDCLVHTHHVHPRPGESADWPEWADPDLVAAYRARGIDKPWRHQVTAAEASWSGRHVVLATATGSGKSLA